MNAPGIVYLLHLAKPLKHARHYIGWAKNQKTFAARLAHHAAGRGARFTAACVEAGIDWTLAKTWEADRHFERQLKNRNGASRFCPCCQKGNQ